MSKQEGKRAGRKKKMKHRKKKVENDEDLRRETIVKRGK